MNQTIVFTAKLVAIMSLVSVATAHEFRVETEVFRAGEDKPISTSLTLCESGLIYDFILSPDADLLADEIAIFDTRERKFVLINVQRKIRTTVHEHQLIRLLSALKSKGVVKQDFMINPVFEESFDLATGWLTLQNPNLTYRAKGESPDDGTKLPIFNEFMEQFARLKATDPRGMPPFARLKLNASIKKYRIVPEEVQLKLTIDANDSQRVIEMNSKHHVIWQLSKQDREYIELAKKYWITFKEVDLKEYRDLDIGLDEMIGEKQNSDE